MINGFLAIDKPQGFTSFDVVAVIRKLLGEKRVGHTGTLDPMATGVLIVLVGKATKAVPFLENAHKKYIADFKLGVETDTQDITGKVLEKCEKKVSLEEIEKILSKFRGEISQVPPMYSAVSVNGKRLYKFARQGIEVERKERNIVISSLSLLFFDEETGCGQLEIECSKGTYIRTLCADIGKALGTFAVMTALRRTEASFCFISDAISVEKARELSSLAKLSESVQRIDVLFSRYSEVEITTKQSVRFKNGGALMLSRVFDKEQPNSGEIYRVYSENEFIGLGKVNSEREELSVLKLFYME